MVENQPIVDNLTGMAERVDGALHIDGTNIEALLATYFGYEVRLLLSHHPANAALPETSMLFMVKGDGVLNGPEDTGVGGLYRLGNQVFELNALEGERCTLAIVNLDFKIVDDVDKLDDLISDLNLGKLDRTAKDVEEIRSAEERAHQAMGKLSEALNGLFDGTKK